VLNAILFIADSHLAALIRGLAGKSNEFAIGAIVQLAEMRYSLTRTLNTTAADVMLVEMSDFDRDVPLAATIHQRSPNIPLVGLTSRDLLERLNSSSNADLSAMVAWPFTVEELEQAISTAVHKAYGGIQENLAAFLPGKAGSGSSTVVLNTARVLAQELGRRVLVIESDLHSGLLSAMLDVGVKSSIRAVLGEAPNLDTLNWQRYVTPVGGVDFLLTNTGIKEPVPAWTHYFQLLRFAATKYDLILVDLPEVVNPATAEIVRRARAVYVVSTPELASLKLSKQRCLELDHWGVERQRIYGLLNRGQRRDIGPEEAAGILGCPVAATFPNDYKVVQRAIQHASSVHARSALGKAYLAFAKALMGEESEKRSFMGLRRK
jgi:Flp pilus assembly CpaE family ATPase